jgi:hypothetical protein
VASRTLAEDFEQPILPVREVGPLGHAQEGFELVGAHWPEEGLVWIAINRLTLDDLRSLERFAGHQLAKVRLSLDSREDLVQKAIVRVLAGTNGRAGRHPRPDDLEAPSAFLRYLKGVISSLVDTKRDLAENRFIHEPWEEECPKSDRDSAAESYVDQEVAFRDILDLFYHELSIRAPARLHRMLLAWKDQRFDSDNIPLQGCHRRLRAELRALAADVFREINQPPISSART